MPTKSIIHTRQVILALLTAQSFIAVLLLIQQLLSPNPSTRPFIVGLFASLWLGLLLIYWLGWEYARQANVVLTTLFVAFALEEPFVNEILSVTLMVPPIIALIMADSKWVVGSMVVQVMILIFRAGAAGIYIDPAALALLTILTGGLLLGRFVIDQARQTAVAHAHAAEQQAEQLRFQAHLLATVEQPIIAIDMQGCITYWNQAAASLFNIPAREAVGLYLTDLADMSFLSTLLNDLTRRGQDRETTRSEHMIERNDGSLLYLLIAEFIVYDKQGDITGFVATFTDLTEHKEIQAQLAQGQKMESIGRLAGGIAHDFNNLLTVILTSIELLNWHNEHGMLLKQKYIDQIEQAARQAANLTGQLLAFSRKQQRQPRVIDLNELVLTMHTLLERLISDDIILRTQPYPTSCPIKIDPTHMEQVIMNLAVNARDAMPDGGQLTIETNITPVETETAGLRPGSYVTLTASDTGSGISPEVSKHIFEPFYTTKELGQGTGLGLSTVSTVYGIIRQNGGECRVYSEPALGTSFKIYLPLVDEVPTTLSEPLVKTAVLGGTETVLVVENTDSIRNLVKDVLREEGYIVITAANGDEALALMRTYDHPIQLLLTDVIMPGMSGIVLAQNLRYTRPQTKVLYMSGYTSEMITRQDMPKLDNAFLEKPFAPYNLLLAVREVLDKDENPLKGKDKTLL